MCLFLTVPLVGLQSGIVTFPGHIHFLSNIVYFKHVNILLLAKKEPELAGNTFKLKNGSVLLRMLWTYLTYAFSVKGI